MNRLSMFALIAVLGCAGCVYDEPQPQTIVIPSTFDRSFDAALGAAGDIGVSVRVADRNTGQIFGSHGGVDVKVDVRRQGDGSVRVAFSPSSSPADPQLGDKWLQAYQRRMGR